MSAMLLLGADAWVCRAAFYLLAAVAVNNALPLKNSMRPTPILSNAPEEYSGALFSSSRGMKRQSRLNYPGGSSAIKKAPVHRGQPDENEKRKEFAINQDETRELPGRAR